MKTIKNLLLIALIAISFAACEDKQSLPCPSNDPNCNGQQYPNGGVYQQNTYNQYPDAPTPLIQTIDVFIPHRPSSSLVSVDIDGDGTPEKKHTVDVSPDPRIHSGYSIYSDEDIFAKICYDWDYNLTGAPIKQNVKEVYKKYHDDPNHPQRITAYALHSYELSGMPWYAGRITSYYNPNPAPEFRMGVK